MSVLQRLMSSDHNLQSMKKEWVKFIFMCSIFLPKKIKVIHFQYNDRCCIHFRTRAIYLSFRHSLVLWYYEKQQIHTRISKIQKSKFINAFRDSQRSSISVYTPLSKNIEASAVDLFIGVQKQNKKQNKTKTKTNKNKTQANKKKQKNKTKHWKKTIT